MNDYSMTYDPAADWLNPSEDELRQDVVISSSIDDLDHDVHGGGGNNNDVDFSDPTIAALPRVLLMGPRRAGKTSIQRVVFQKMSPHETLFRLEATQELERTLVDHTQLNRFTIWDFPGDYYVPPPNHNHSNPNGAPGGGFHMTDQQTDQMTDDSTNNDNFNPNPYEQYDDMFKGTTSLVFVVDAQDEPYDHVLQSFTSCVTRAVSVNPNIVIEVFINKVDGELFLSDESKYDCRRDIMTQVNDELNDMDGFNSDSIQIRYHLTSIYDHSLYEALSKVVQRLIPALPTLENLLNVLVSTCNMEKAYLFDVVSKLYISTDSGPVDIQSVELCSDMIDVVLDVSGIYGLGPPSATSTNGGLGDHHPDENNDTNAGGMVRTDSADAADNVNGVDVDDLDVVDPDSAYDNESASVIRLNNGMVLYLKEVDAMLALVCITRSENFRKKSLINYNIKCLKKALQALSTTTTTTTQITTGGNNVKGSGISSTTVTTSSATTKNQQSTSGGGGSGVYVVSE